MNDSYHFASVPQFRVGGVYRGADGRVLKVAHVVTDTDKTFYEKSTAVMVEAFASEERGWYATGWRRLEDGQYHDREWPEADLIPGELHQVNGEWVPVEQKLSFPSGSVLTTSGDKIVGREEPDWLDVQERFLRSLNELMVSRDDRPRTERETIFAINAAMRASQVAAAEAAKGRPLLANANLLKTA